MSKPNIPILIFLISFLFLYTSCEKNENISPNPIISDEDQYFMAIEDAMIAEQEEICHHLIDINDSNPYLIWNGIEDDKKVLVVTWTKYPESYPENATVMNTWGEIWVTVVPEMVDWFAENYSSGSDFVLRTEKLLGLPKDDGNTHFVELWVEPADLWRPSPDNEITDQSAQLDFPANVDSTYQSWYNDNILYSYYPMRYPWTRLGYTYDWDCSTSEIGLSEFVVKRNSMVTVNKVHDNVTFFNNLDQ